MSSERIVGNVNWFDSKKGYGFATVVTPDLENTGSDIFIHFSNITVGEGDYKRLYPGEYIEFTLDTSPDGRPCCANVTGLCGGKLLTENENHRYKIYPKNPRPTNTDAEEAEDAEDAEDADVEDADGA